MERNEAIEVIKKNYPHVTESGSQFETALRLLIPELKDGDDERIRKEILEYFNQFENGELRGVDITPWIAWLEKQVEQKPADKVEPKFKVGDTMMTLREAANGVTNGMPVVVSIDEEYYHCNNELIAIKDQDGYEYPPMNRRQKPAWSEEDEIWIDRACMLLDELNHLSTLTLAKIPSNVNDIISHLKSLKDKYTWKPSDEQMHALHDLNITGNISYAGQGQVLIGLYNDLKKLKGE